MKIEFEVWHLVTLLLTLAGAFFTLAKLLLGQQLKHIDAAFAAQNARLAAIEQANKDEVGNWHRIEREILQLKAELPLNYVRREDYVQTVATIMAKLDAISLRMENILLKIKGVNND